MARLRSGPFDLGGRTVCGSTRPSPAQSAFWNSTASAFRSASGSTSGAIVKTSSTAWPVPPRQLIDAVLPLAPAAAAKSPIRWLHRVVLERSGSAHECIERLFRARLTGGGWNRRVQVVEPLPCLDLRQARCRRGRSGRGPALPGLVETFLVVLRVGRTFDRPRFSRVSRPSSSVIARRASPPRSRARCPNRRTCA